MRSHQCVDLMIVLKIRIIQSLTPISFGSPEPRAPSGDGAEVPSPNRAHVGQRRVIPPVAHSRIFGYARGFSATP